MVKLRTNSELKLIRKSGLISALALKKVIGSIRPGITTLELDKIAEAQVRKLGGEPAFRSVPGYSWTTCITINEQVVHGIPTNRRILKGDLVSVDLGAIYQGWYSDTAWSVLVDGNVESKKFVRVGEEALWEGIKQAVVGHTIGDISAAIQEKVEGGGYSVVKSLVGHGVGQKLHEDPQIPGFGVKGQGLVLQKNMTLAIEVIYTKGSGEVVLDSDGWTISSQDRSLGGLFEMTVVAGEKKGEVLTDWRKV